MTEQSGPIRVLYVEDDPGAARLLEKRLTRAGYAVDLAGNGDQGLAAWQAGSYDVLAVDHDLPGRTGLEIIADLAARGPLPPTVMITGRGSEAIAVEAMMLGADDYIIKDSESYYLDLIPTRIQRALNRKRLLEEKRLAEEDALRARDEWERTFDAVEDLLVILDTEHTIVRGNQAAALRLGLTKEELVGKTCYTLFHGTQSPPDFCPCPKMLATGNKSEEVIEEEKLRGIFHITAAPLRDGEGTII
ncbi:MAG: response regulator, partial [Deltaproteobacteria bacterium]|nr:response regulator [Deltaproteobacteria bacterium]